MASITSIFFPLSFFNVIVVEVFFFLVFFFFFHLFQPQGQQPENESTIPEVH